MDAVGSLKLSWAQGYDGAKLDYITRDVLCYKCANNIKFISEDGHETVFSALGDSMGPIAVHKVNKVFAYGEVGLEPKIYVLQYPSFRIVTEFTDGAQLEYTSLAFSTSNYLVSLTGIPEFQLILWNYDDGSKLVSHSMQSHTIPRDLSFNPANWREICATADDHLTVWRIEQSNTEYKILEEKLHMPALEGEIDEEVERDVVTRASTRMSRATVQLPQSATAGVTGDEAESFARYQDHRPRCIPMSHCWLPSGDFLIGCAGGQLLKVNGETYKLQMLTVPSVRGSSAYSRGGSAKPPTRDISLVDLEPTSASSLGNSSVLMEGAVNCLALHRQGLFAAGEDGTLRHLEVTNDQVKILTSYPVGVPINSLFFNPIHHRLAAGSVRGSVFLFNPEDPGSVKTLLDVHHGNFVGVAVLAPGNDLCVTVREDGELQIWNMNDAKLMGALPIGFATCSLATSSLAAIVAVGTSAGHIYLIDVSRVDNPRLIYREHFHQGPVKQLVFNETGLLLVSGGDDGHVFVLDGRPSTKFQPLGHTAVPGTIEAIGVFLDSQTDINKIVLTTNTTQNHQVPSTKLFHFNLPTSVTSDAKRLHGNLKYEFSDESINKMGFNLTQPAYGIALPESGFVYVLSQTTKSIQRLPLPTQPPKKEHSKDSYLQPLEQEVVHELTGGTVIISPHLKWLASCSTDGKLSVRAIGTLDRSVEIRAHSYQKGGIKGIAFSADGQKLLSVGHDGALICYTWSFDNGATNKAKQAIDWARARQSRLLQQQHAENDAAASMPEWVAAAGPSRPDSGFEKADEEALEKEKEIERALENDMIYTTPTPTPGSDSTWLEAKELEAIKEEDKEYSELKKQLRTEIRDMRRNLQNMMRENESVEEIRRLARYEFDLDVEEQTRLQGEGDAEVQRIREEKEYDNLAKMYLAELIRKECWDDMECKGRGLVAFAGQIEVHNYPMKARQKSEVEELVMSQEQRRIQLAEFQTRKQLTEAQKKPSNTQQNLSTALREKFNMKNDEDGVEDADGDVEDDAAPSTGSLAIRCGGGSELLHSQFELHTREQKIQQIILLKDSIYRIQKSFNNEFSEVFDKKEQEIAKIHDRNKRIYKILEELEMEEEVIAPEMGPVEKPEMLLTVKDTEVKVEKYLSPEARRRQEEEKKADDERRQRERQDNWRERGLDMMMGGVLEIKKEDELKKDIPPPSFLLTKEEDDWTEDDRKILADYEKRVKELEEEREKYRKQLEMELRKLQSQIQDGTQMFDESLAQLFIKKIKTQMAIYQEELKIMRLRYSLLVEEELTNRDMELALQLEDKKRLKIEALARLTEAKKQVSDFRDQYNKVEGEDKYLQDRGFRREFSDVPAVYLDQLLKLFRRKPRGQKARAADTPMYEPGSGNPFADRPSTALKSDQARRATENALAELDKESNMPEGIDPGLWQRFCLYRRQKIESDQQVKKMAQTLAAMEEFQRKRQDEDEALRLEIDAIIHSINKMREDRQRFTCNLEIQLVMKQGQVEVDPGQFIADYKDSLLIDRGVVEELNGKIRQLGEGKIASMIESKDFRKGIIQLEWEHQQMTMELEDLQNRMRDIQSLKVTREIQLYLTEADYDAKKQQEIQTLEQTIQLQKQHHEKKIQEKKCTMKDLKRTVRDKADENNSMSSELQEINVSVNERRVIHEVNAEKTGDAGWEERYRQIVQRRKLVDLAKAQAQEVAVLRAEVERLRMRTFPALVQVEH